mmetsp:Transcript_35632/g.37027  ORF Transcript_35632/g.37027 Transcript_35632/m.37027 type:complete len:110 (-) Transcript_35632:9-338(-)
MKSVRLVQLILCYVLCVFIITTEMQGLSLSKKGRLRERNKSKYDNFYGVNLDGPAGQVFSEMFGKNWNHPSHAGERYRGDFIANGFNKFYGGDGYDMSNKLAAMREKSG